MAVIERLDQMPGRCGQMAQQKSPTLWYSVFGIHSWCLKLYAGFDSPLTLRGQRFPRHTGSSRGEFFGEMGYSPIFPKR
jgi:hypothetical protein